MPSIALLIRQTTQLEDDNYFRMARELTSLGHQVTCISVDTLSLASHASLKPGDSVVQGSGFQWQAGLQVGAAFPACNNVSVNQDLVWLLCLGDRATFLDKIQLLYALPSTVKLINSLDALMHLKSKYYLTSRPDIFPTPETHAGTDASRLEAIIRDKGGKWIIKPPAGSLGRDVFLTAGTDNNLPAILAHLCGPDNDEYAMIQRYIPEIESGEKRVLLACGEIIGQYRRTATGNDHRTNISQGAIAEPCELTEAEIDYCKRLAAELVGHGTYFAGIDLAYPWLIEINVVNPGGLVTIDELTGTDHSSRIAQLITRALPDIK